MMVAAYSNVYRRGIHPRVLGAGTINNECSPSGARTHNSCGTNRLAVNSKRANRLRHLTIPKKEWVDGANQIARYSLLGVVFSHPTAHSIPPLPPYETQRTCQGYWPYMAHCWDPLQQVQLSFQLVSMSFHAVTCLSMSQSVDKYTGEVYTQVLGAGTINNESSPVGSNPQLPVSHLLGFVVVQYKAY